jgi:hypothetical protein
MNQAIANIIKSHIEGLDFVDKIAGLTRVLTFDIKGPDNTPVQKSFPVACCVTAEDCKEGAYNELMPNSEYKTVIYFEDKGIQFNRHEGRYKFYTSNVRLVCWINAAKILGDDCKEGTACTLASHLIVEIIRALPGFPAHHNPFNSVYSEVVNQEVSSPSIFSDYTYDEKHIQYLMYPYDYFALDVQTTFAICMQGTGVYDSDCGHRTDTLAAPVATAGTGKGTNSFIANWNTVSGASGYTIDVATDPGFTSFVVHDNRIGNVLTINITGLDANTIYYYRVRAYNDYTESENSNVITVLLYSDYSLPSKDALAAMRTELFVQGVGGFTGGKYWTSSEYDANQAWMQQFSNGGQSEDTKTGLYNVRACRAFTSTTVYNLRDIGPAGGLIFYKNGNNYMECPITNQSDSREWSNINSVVVSGTGTGINDSSGNTDKIIAQAGHIDSAAKLCKDLII